MGNKSKDVGGKEKAQRPPQKQKQQPGKQEPLKPQPVSEPPGRTGSDRLKGKVALISGGDSGIGRAVSLAFAREGADVAIIYLDETADAKETQRLVEEKGRRCVLIEGDVGKKAFCDRAVKTTISKLGGLDILVNNAAEQHPQESITDISEKQLERTFRTNIYSMFFLTAAALPHLKKSKGASIINTASVTAYRGSPKLLDYSATKGAIVSFTRSLAGQLIGDGIRVNGVAPGPIWTPLIAATFPPEEVAKFGSDSPLGRAGEPWECGECFLFLASEDASYMTGQVIHPNGGEIVGG
jgi:NAD(P)-dependent dehydrogenase (short-subunit alcohol dehydrogenase family)